MRAVARLSQTPKIVVWIYLPPHNTTGGCMVMASNQGPKQTQADELSVAPGEDLDTWAKRVRPKAVINPEVLAAERARQDESREETAGRSRRLARRAVKWLLWSVLALAGSLILHQVVALSWWVAVASAVAVAVGIAAAVRASRLERNGTEIEPGFAQGQNEIVRLAELDGSCRALLQRARQAIDETLSSLDHPGSLYERIDRQIELRDEEWTLAVRLRAIARHRAECDADPATTADSAARHRVEIAQDQVEAWVRKLEELAVEFKAASIAEKRYQGRGRASQLDDKAINLGASVEVDAELAIERIKKFRKGLADRRKYLEDEMGENI
jgi:hypothetical protein